MKFISLAITLALVTATSAVAEPINWNIQASSTHDKNGTSTTVTAGISGTFK